MMPIDFALKELADGVREIPKGSNTSPRVDAYTGERREPWCAHFVVWCFRQAGIKLPGDVPEAPTKRMPNPIAYVATMERECRKAGFLFSPNDNKKHPLQPNDIIFLTTRGDSDRGPGRHVGIVERVVDLSYVDSIEGNWGDRVARVRRYLASPAISSYARIPDVDLLKEILCAS